MKLPVHIRRLHKDVPFPEFKTDGAIAFDIAIPKGGVIPPGESVIFSTGLVVATPKGYGLILASRSSNAKKGIVLTNGIGVIDQDYCGPEDELRLSLRNLNTEPYIVEDGERLAQGIFFPVPEVTFEEVETLSAPNRGGFGTTG